MLSHIPEMCKHPLGTDIFETRRWSLAQVCVSMELKLQWRLPVILKHEQAQLRYALEENLSEGDLAGSLDSFIIYV